MPQTMASSSCIFTATTTHNNTSPSLFKSSSLRPSTAFISPFVAGSVSTNFSGHKLRPLTTSPSSSRPKRSVVTMVIPFTGGSAYRQPPPDLASYLFSHRIVYLGMPLLPSVTELMLAEFIYLQYESERMPIFFYINSTGTTKGDVKLSYDTEALAIYDIMRYVRAPIFTLCVGNAWGEASLLLAAGKKGYRAALPSSTIMMKQPLGQFKGQVSDIEIARKEVTRIKSDLVKLFARHTGKSPEEIQADMRRPKYFSPSEAIEYGIIDKIIHTERTPREKRKKKE